MGKLTTIENKLCELGGNEFQELCDLFLSRVNHNYITYSRLGSQAGKLQTVRGTPDSFLALGNGKYIFVEHTVDESNKDKLVNDIKSCLDEKKSKIPTSKIAEIIFCVARKVTTEETEAAQKLLQNTNIRLKIYNLQELAMKLSLHHNDIVHQCLGLPYDSAQVVTIERFIKEYERASKNIATPLSNEFFHRSDEIALVISSLGNHDFTIIRGAAGVGKTKLAIESIQQFLKENLDFQAYCISFKSASLVNDLPQYFESDKNYIIFVDDANRIDTIEQILFFYKNVRQGQLKIVLTVRDYAFEYIGNLCFDFKPNSIEIEGLKDEELTDIIQSDSVGIKNPDYQKEIIRIADGNPRIALMAAKLAKDKQSLSALHDVTDLFDRYFQTFIKDDNYLGQGDTLKFLGLIAFFNVMPYSDKDATTSILQQFGLDYDVFFETINKLDKLEIVELQYDFVKIPEQNLATYFFFTVFFKRELLSFKVLLDSYYSTNRQRFKDTIIPASDNFSDKKVMAIVVPALKDYLRSTPSEDLIPPVLSDFWFFLQDDTLKHIYNAVEQIPEEEEPKYQTSYEQNQFSYNKNPIIEILQQFLRAPHKVKDASELLFEYVRKCPEHLPELIYTLRERMVFTLDDDYSGFIRQTTFVEWLISKFSEGNILFVQTFYAIADDFLKCQYRYDEARKRDTITMCTLTLPLSDEIKDLRKKLWNEIRLSFSTYPALSLKLLNEHSAINPDEDESIMRYDKPFIESIVKNELTPHSFEHCHYVQHQIHWWKENNIETDESTLFLKEQFVNPLYIFYQKIKWDRIGDQFAFECDDHEKFQILKEKEVRQFIEVHTIQDFENFYEQFAYIAKWEKNGKHSVDKTILLVVQECFLQDFDLGLKTLEVILTKNNEISFPIEWFSFKVITTPSQADAVFSLISKYDFQNKNYWQVIFFEQISVETASEKQYTNFLLFINSINYSTYLNFSSYQKYEQFNDNLFVDLLKIVIGKNAQGIAISLERGFFHKNISKLNSYISIAKQAYLQQEGVAVQFDNKGKCFLAILTRDRSFYYEYIKELLNKDTHIINRLNLRKLSVIWELNAAEGLIIDAFNLLLKNVSNYTMEKITNFIFKPNQEFNDRQSNFIKNYISSGYADYQKMNIVLGVIHNSAKHLFKTSLLQYIELNQNIEDFEKIAWRKQGGSYMGNVNLGDIRASEWKNIQTIVEQSTVGLRLIPIKTYIQNQIDISMLTAESERRRRFLYNDY